MNARARAIVRAAEHLIRLRRKQCAAGIVGAQTSKTAPPPTHTRKDEIRAERALDEAVGPLDGIG